MTSDFRRGGDSARRGWRRRRRRRVVIVVVVGAWHDAPRSTAGDELTSLRDARAALDAPVARGAAARLAEVMDGTMAPAASA
jgi:hypothetical protein